MRHSKVQTLARSLALSLCLLKASPHDPARPTSFVPNKQRTDTGILGFPRALSRHLLPPHRSLCCLPALAAAPMAQPAGEGADWKAKLNLPPKDTRIRTEVRRMRREGAVGPHRGSSRPGRGSGPVMAPPTAPAQGAGRGTQLAQRTGLDPSPSGSLACQAAAKAHSQCSSSLSCAAPSGARPAAGLGGGRGVCC
jgi:hypothetical protein